MDSLDEESGHDLDEVARGDSRENSRLVNPPANAKMNCLNIFNNISCLIFTLYITFMCFKDGIMLFSFHPTCMAIGWLLLMAAAIHSITPGDAATEWMPAKNRSTRHWILQASALSVITIGFLAIVFNKIRADKYHFTTYHGCFGLASYLMALAAASGGVTALYSLKFKTIVTPLYIKFIHSAAGLVTFVLGVVTIILALFSDWWAGGESLRILFSVLLVSIIVMTTIRPGVKLGARIIERITYIRSST